MGKSILFWEDRLKLGEYFISNKVVQISEALGGTLPAGWSPLVESYIEGDCGYELWFRLTSAEGNSCDFHAVFKFASSPHFQTPSHEFMLPSSVFQCSDSSWKPWRELCTLNHNQHKSGTAMFVVVPESMEDVKRMRLWFIPSLVRLEVLNEFDGIAGKAAIERCPPFSKTIAAEIDGEVQITQFPLGTARDASELPNHVVHNRTKVMDAIASNKGQPRWRFFHSLQLEPHDLVDSIEIFLGHQVMWYTFTEPLGLTLEAIQVQLCPPETKIHPFEVSVHQ